MWIPCPVLGVIQTEVVTEVIIEAVTISPAQLQEEEVTIPMELWK